jgi:transcriptional regulator with XRE-family HTH domain
MGRASREMPLRLGEKLLHIRKALGLSQDGMLRRLGLAEDHGRHYISGFETGEREPSLRVLMRYSEAARVWINAIVDDDVDLPKMIPCAEMHAGARKTRKNKAQGKRRGGDSDTGFR